MTTRSKVLSDSNPTNDATVSQYPLENSTDCTVVQWYDQLARMYPDIEERQFMNYGYVDMNEDSDLRITQTSMNLYEQVVAGVPLEGKDILEVSCGRGAGAAWCVRTYQPRFFVGVDISSDTIALCHRNYATMEGLAFVVTDAVKTLPFTNESFDVVLSVEATHEYGGPEKVGQFAREVARILRPHGYLLWCDLCAPEENNTSVECFIDTGEFLIEEKIDITRNVLRALDMRSKASDEVIRRTIATSNQAEFREFAGIPGTAVYEDLRQGRTIYWRAVLRKKAH